MILEQRGTIFIQHIIPTNIVSHNGSCAQNLFQGQKNLGILQSIPLCMASHRNSAYSSTPGKQLNTQIKHLNASYFTCQRICFYCPSIPDNYRVLPHSTILSDRREDPILFCCNSVALTGLVLGM